MKFYNFLSVPNPTSVIVTTDQPIPIRAGTEVTLICIVELSPALAELSSSLGVIVVWTGPSETLTGSDLPALIGNSPPTYTSMLLLASVDFNGNYTCQAQVVSSSSSLTNSGMEANTITVTTCEQASVLVCICGLHMYMYVNSSLAVDILMSIDILSGTNTAGETYSLECSATMLGSTDQPTITWLDSRSYEMATTGDGARTASVTTMNPDGSYSCSLTFNPLAASDAGLFMCRVTEQGPQWS